MKKYIGLFIVLLCMLFPVKVQASDPQLVRMQATGYCLNGQTADGSYTQSGICASKPEWIGKIAAIYAREGGKLNEYMGSYRITDTGGDPIKQGKVIDIWFETEEECRTFGSKDVFVFILDGDAYGCK